MGLDFFSEENAGLIWLGAGLALAVLELVVPGVYLIWLALAALGTALLSLLFGIGPVVQVVSFSIFALITVYSAKKWLRDRPIESQDPLLNDKAGRLLGETAVVTVAISGGEGRASLGDSEWIARGADAKKGDRVRITDVKGPILEVEPLS